MFGQNTVTGTVTDVEGNIYSTVKIGDQVWMAENLNVGTMVTSVNTGSNHSDVSNNSIIEKYCYNNDANYCNKCGNTLIENNLEVLTGDDVFSFDNMVKLEPD